MEMCRGSCHGLGLTVPLVKAECPCTLIYRSSGDGVIEIEHSGTHTHDKLWVSRATKAELEVYKQEAERHEQIPPKKKFARHPPNRPIVRTIRCESGSRLRVWT